MLWPDFRFLHEDFTGSDFPWLLVGALLALVVIYAIAIEAALILDAPHRLRSRVRWPADVSDSTIRQSPTQVDFVGSDTPI
jgi:hypothetical protein